jgi:hypothetical protein
LGHQLRAKPSLLISTILNPTNGLQAKPMKYYFKQKLNENISP